MSENVLKTLDGSQNACSSADMDGYTYQPLSDLKNIRLIQIHEGEGDIHVSLSEAQNKSPRYDALSYTWGSPTVPEEGGQIVQPVHRFIYCDKKRFQITSNLFDALLQFRTDGKRGPLWVDAICINQKNIVERNAQVSAMGDIYANANCVVLWLGRADDNAKETCFLISELAQATNNFSQKYAWTPNSLEFNDPKLYAESPSALSPLDKRQWRLLMEPYNRAWFMRVWVLQEISLAGRVNVSYGPVSIAYQDLEDFAKFMNLSAWTADAMNFIVGVDKLLLGVSHFGDSGINFLKYKFILDMACDHTLSSSESMLELLYGVKEPAENYPRDHVFASLSLASRFLPQKPEPMDWMLPDYSHDVGRVFLDVTVLLLRNSVKMSVLSNAGRKEVRNDLTAPFWVPDFDIRPTLNPLDLKCPYRATKFWGKFDDRALRFQAPNILQIKGSTYDSIIKCICMVPYIFRDDKLQSLLELVTSLPDKSETVYEPVEVLWRTLSGDSFEMKNPAPTDLGISFYQYVLHEISIALIIAPDQGSDMTLFWKKRASYEQLAKSGLLPSQAEITARAAQYRQSELQSGFSGPRYVVPSSHRLMNDFQTTSVPYTSGRSLFLCQKGHLGLAPSWVRSGDVIAFVRNADVPFVLREVSPKSHEFIGEAYVQGLMYGELAEKGPPPLNEINLQ